MREIPYFPDWVEAYRAASELPEETDPQIVESTRKAVNRHVTTACQFLKNILSKTRFHTDPVCVTRIAEYYECDKQGRRRTEPDEDENGNLIEDENGELKKRFVVRSRAVRVGVHYIRPLPKNPLYQKSMEIITNYCASTSSPNQKPLPMLYENCPKHRLFHTQWISGTFKDTPESSAKAKCWWEQLRHPAKSNPAYVENLKQYIENGIEGDVKGVSPGPDFTRAQYSTTQGALIENTITFMNNEMGLDYLKSLGKEVWVKKVAKSTNAEWYIKKSIQPWFDDTYKLDDNNRWVVKPSIEYPEICRLDPITPLRMCLRSCCTRSLITSAVCTTSTSTVIWCTRRSALPFISQRATSSRRAPTRPRRASSSWETPPRENPTSVATCSACTTKIAT